MKKLNNKELIKKFDTLYFYDNNHTEKYLLNNSVNNKKRILKIITIKALRIELDYFHKNTFEYFLANNLPKNSNKKTTFAKKYFLLVLSFPKIMFTFAQDNIKRSKITHRNMAKIVTMGEIMLRLSTPGNSRFVQSDSFDVNYGGGEANVAVSLQNYGNEAFFISKIPAHEIGQAAINSLRRFGVHVSFVARGGDRLGIYYLETGSSLRSSKVIYDRANSSISQATPDDFDFDAIFRGADGFHWSGITPALGKNMAECIEKACRSSYQPLRGPCGHVGP